ncbi:MAG: hypothetical protein K1X95_04650 [Acidimicrobiia bacterium]|nr:hypothetical protein [Acidimicrobiia bacterium]
MTRRRKRWLAIALVMVVIPSISLPLVGAQAEDSKVIQQEVVTAKLGIDGDVREVRDETFLRLQGTGTMNVQQPTAATDTTAGPDSTIKVADGKVLVSADVKSPQNPTSVYYSGNGEVIDSDGTVMTSRGERQLPIRVKTEYTFDGAKVRNLEDLRGKGGTLEMKITVENITGQAQEVNYKDSTSGMQVTDVGFVFVPLTVNLGPWFFDDANWKDLQVEGAQLTRNGTASVVQGSNVLFPPTTPASYQITVKGLTKDFDLQPARITAVPGIGTELPDSVQDKQQLGGGSTTQLYDALQQFLAGFEKLTSPTEGLPFAASGVDQIIQQGLFKLKDGITGTVLPGVADLLAGLTAIRNAVRDDLAPGLAQIRDILGTSAYTTPMCRDLPVNREGGCTFSQVQLPELPPNPALRDTFAIAAAWDPAAGRYIYQRIQRTRAGQLGSDLQATHRNDDGTYLGSLYNWASMARFAVGLETDADGDGLFPDFEGFVWPDPDQHPEYYTSAAMSVVARKKGSLLPGFTDSGGPGPNKDVLAVCKIVAAVNFGVPQSTLDAVNDSTDTNHNRVHDLVEQACGPVPFDDVTLKDILQNTARLKFPRVSIKFGCLSQLLAFFTGGTATCEGDQSGAQQQMAAMASAAGFPPVRPPEPPDEFCTDMPGGASDPNCKPVQLWEVLFGNTPLILDVPIGDVLVTNSNLGLNRALAKPAQLALNVRLGNVDRHGSATAGIDYNLNEDRPPYVIPVQQSTCLTTGDATKADGLSLNLGELLGLGCNVAYAGSLGSVEAATTAIGMLLTNPGWNFDNWLRGDPGYQVSDLENTDTGPKLYEAMNIIAYQLDRKDALCPATLATDSDGSGTPRPIPPPLDTPCDQVKPDSTTSTDPDEQQKDATAVGALSNLILPGVGDPKHQKFKAGLPADLATFLNFVVTSIGTDDAADVGVTLAGSLAAVRDGLNGAVVQLQPAVTGTPLLVGAVGNVQVEGDLQTALSKAGIERAKNWTSFQGLASSDGKDAEGQLIFVFEAQGLQT